MTPEGIHLGPMTGIIDVFQRCRTGIEMRDEVLWLNPCLPDKLNEIRLRIHYRGHWLRLHAQRERLIVSFEHGWTGQAKIGFDGQVYEFSEGDHREFVFSKT